MSGLYRRVIGQMDQIVNRSFPSGPVNSLWHHEAGPKTFFLDTTYSVTQTHKILQEIFVDNF